jgi:type IV secretory pathway VirB4 component
MSVDLIGVINFYSHTKDGSRPLMDATPTLGYPTANYVQIPTPVKIYDLRGKENHFNLDQNGFEVHKYVGNIHNVFDDHSEEQQSYYEDTRNALKNRLGASRVVPFWHVIRFRGPPRPADQCDQTHKNPVYYPHVDSDPPAAKAKVIQILGEEEGQKLMKNRFQIINIWKPLGQNPIVNNPLTICDYQSIDVNNDIHSSEVIASENTISLYMISQKMENTQKWYYLSNMKSNEMLMIKIFDSDPNVAQFGAHTAFINEDVPSADTEQCSVEIRCLVFYDKSSS